MFETGRLLQLAAHHPAAVPTSRFNKYTYEPGRLSSGAGCSCQFADVPVSRTSRGQRSDVLVRRLVVPTAVFVNDVQPNFI